MQLIERLKEGLGSLEAHSPVLRQNISDWLDKNFADYRGFEKILDNLHREEGGYVNHPRDPGGETNFGITKHTALQHGYNGSMRTMPRIVADYIYITSYIPVSFYNLSPILLDNYVDFAVNAGKMRATKFLQSVLVSCGERDLAIDGIPGPATARACMKHNPFYLICLFRGLCLEHYTNLPTFKEFGLGWTRRVSRKLLDCQA